MGWFKGENYRGRGGGKQRLNDVVMVVERERGAF